MVLKNNSRDATLDGKLGAMRHELNSDGGFRFLAGGGEMGERIRAFDWSHSPLGPIEKWPQSLKTSVSLILNTAHPMWIGWGRDVTFLYNDAYINVLSMAKHPQALGKPSSEVWAEIWDICSPLVEKVYRNGESSFRNDVRFLMNRGDFVEEKYYSFSYSPIRDESGNVGGLFCPSTDVTPKVLNARRLHTLSKLAAKSLAEKSTKNACVSVAATLAENPEDIPFALLYLIEADGKLARLEQSVGIPAGVHPISPTTSELAGPPNKGGLWPVRQVFAKPHLRAVSIQGIEGFPIGLAGQRVSEAVTLPVLSGGQEQPLAIIVAGVNPARKMDSDYRTFYELIAGHIAIAITNARSAEEQKKRADMLAELDRAKTTFFSNVSHEFRTPLTLMLGPLEDLLARKKQKAGIGDAPELEIIHRNSLRLLKLVNTLLDFSRIEAGRVRASYVETDLAALTADLASVFRSAMERAGLEFTVDCEPLAQPVFVDRDMWEKVVFNLLSNALKFTLSGGVEISVRSENGAAAMRVRDTGIGIPSDELPNVFKRFHRIENARGRSHEGTGIGLALACELVKLHGGSIEVESEPGRGSIFKVKIPFGCSHLDPKSIGLPPADAPAKLPGRGFLEEASSWLPNNVSAMSDRRNSVEREGGTKDELNIPRPRIVLAEDNADMRDYICRLLSQRYEVEAVGDGAKALEAARKNAPKLVLSDVMMPRLDGLGLLRGLRSDPATRDIPIILLSARAGEDAVMEGVETGANDYLTKPFSARELLTRVAAHLETDRTRKESAEKIRQSEEKYRNLFNTLLEGFCIVEMIFDVNGKPVDYRFLEINPAFEQQTGLQAAQGKLMRELVPGHDAHWFEIYGKIALTGEPAQFENEARAMNRWYKVSAFRVGGAESRRVAILFNDITASKQAEEALRRSERRERERAEELAVMIESIPTPLIIVHDPESTHMTGNRAANDLMHIPRNAEISMSAQAKSRPAHFKAFKDGRELRVDELPAQRAARGEYIQDFELSLVFDDGTTRVLLAYGTPLLDEQGRPRGAVHTLVDITERKQAEALLRQNEALFSSLVNLAPTGVYVVDAQFRLQQINARALPAFEKVQPAAGRDFAEVMQVLWGPEVGGEIVKIFRHTLATGEKYISPRFSNFRQDLGEEKTYEWETRRMTLPDGQHGVVCYFNDITDNARAEQVLREAKAAAENANRSKDHFIAALSHELRTPLNPVLMTAAALREDERLPADVREQLGMMERNIALEARLIDDLLDISAIANNKLHLHMQMSDTHSLIRLAVEMVRDDTQTKEIKLACNLNAARSALMTDPARFQQIIWNLLRNAVKFTPRGGSIFIQTSDQEAGRLKIEITDSGIGIDPAALEKIFLPFEQAAIAGNQRFGGLGLGLAIVRSIVNIHGGSISAKSAGANRGATFIVEFPRATFPPPDNANETLLAAAGASRLRRAAVRPQRLLLVEDHLPTLQALSSLLSRDGHQVVAVGSIAEALAAASVDTFDLVISDLGLPDGTGNQMMEKLHEAHGLKGIALSGYGMDEDILRSREAGFVTHLVKPVHMTELRRALVQVS
jgi:PAS domain S-box-containing protein